MAPSQLKQLKASLREHGVLSPQKSKKQRKANGKDAAKRVQRNAALEGIRERFNPFEVKKPARKEKFDVADGRVTKSTAQRPGVTRGLGEERRRETLLREMQSRNKVGGMMDRRFGENDPTMSLEEKAAERFARQSMRTAKKNSMFNLEDESEEEMVLTHGGRSLALDTDARDDFAEDLGGSGEEDFDDQDDRPRKRPRMDEDEAEEDGDDENLDAVPERRKTKNEVMKEVIAKSKLYKAERQAAKADDDDLRAELDKGMRAVYDALRGQNPTEKQLPSPPNTDTEPAMDPARAAMLAGKPREDAEKEYEANLRELKLEARSKPSVRIKTDEEKAAEQAARLEELERKRLRRMKGEAESSDEEQDVGDEVEDLDDEVDDAEAFGLTQPEYPPRPQLDVEDEDDFVIDDIIASDSEADLASSDADSGSESEREPDDDGDDDFINGLVLPKVTDIPSMPQSKGSQNLAYTFPCPQTHAELLEVTKSTRVSDLPTIVQRIRALYHKGLAKENEEKLGNFVAVLLEHIAYLADSEGENAPFSVLESLLRHLHSMAKTQPEDVGLAFRNHLRTIAEKRPLALTPGDLVVLTGVSTIFPTSDHFHSVVTPAMLTIARYLGQSSVQSLVDLARGAYCCTLALQYQRFSKRYVPEVIQYIVNAFAILAPVPLPEMDSTRQSISVPIRLPETPLRLTKTQSAVPQSVSFNDLRASEQATLNASSVLHLLLKISLQAGQLWQTKSAFPDIMKPIQQALNHLLQTSSKEILSTPLRKALRETSTKLSSLVSASLANRKPLLLHNHRPLAIKSSIPAFVENFNPDRHYDPDRERAELSKLKAEHKKERKGAMRELRKDANFIAREQLREKKAKDEAYDKKFKRLVAEIQGEEGKEAKEYEREKARRKGK